MGKAEPSSIPPVICWEKWNPVPSTPRMCLESSTQIGIHLHRGGGGGGGIGRQRREGDRYSLPSCSQALQRSRYYSWPAELEGWGRTCTDKDVAPTGGGEGPAPRETSLQSMRTQRQHPAEEGAGGPGFQKLPSSQ